MARAQFHTFVDPKVLEEFKARAKTEGRPYATIVNRFMELYAQGKLKLWEE